MYLPEASVTHLVLRQKNGVEEKYPLCAGHGAWVIAVTDIRVPFLLVLWWVPRRSCSLRAPLASM